MQKTTKDLFARLKELRPSIHSISYYYGIDYKEHSNDLIERFYLELPEVTTFNTEKELRDKMRELIDSTESELGFRFPHSVKLLNLNEHESSSNKTD